ncbi:Fic family protein [Kineococcus sp. LSe6-4]|uniref:Fic family protein n=1 Tax=Kineococcus halophytocola TaxID=3234027 RepID=A0ABV4H1N8_9ACTN
MRDWITSIGRLKAPGEEPFPERLARLHNDFERLHPFIDGNGRTGRLLLNLVLVRLGHPPAIVFKNDRTRYLAAMRRADQADYGPMGELLARSITNNLYRFVVPAVAGPSRLVPLASLMSTTDDLSADALRVAAIRGRLRAQKSPQGVWLSSRTWVDEYRDSRHRRGSRSSRDS